jgi:hypothetical protein
MQRPKIAKLVALIPLVKGVFCLGVFAFMNAGAGQVLYESAPWPQPWPVASDRLETLWRLSAMSAILFLIAVADVWCAFRIWRHGFPRRA